MYVIFTRYFKTKGIKIMKQIYLIFTDTGTILSKIIKIYTKRKYAHISISLDEKLNRMYSFGRLNPYIAFIGGFVHEGIHHGTFKRFKNTDAQIAKLEISEKQYEQIEKIIHRFDTNRKKYRFNTIGLFAVVINKKIKRKDAFYCAEFIRYILDEAKIENNLPEIIKPEDFFEINNLDILYNGKLNKYN